MEQIPPADTNFWAKCRLETYENWPFKSPKDTCTPERMAAAGFVCIGNANEPDLAECFICTKQLDGWESTDDPWQEHASHQPTCPYILLNKKSEESWTIGELLGLLKTYLFKERTRTKELEIARFTNDIRKIEKDIPKKLRESRLSKKSLK